MVETKRTKKKKRKTKQVMAMAYERQKKTHKTKHRPKIATKNRIASMPMIAFAEPFMCNVFDIFHEDLDA